MRNYDGAYCSQRSIKTFFFEQAMVIPEDGVDPLLAAFLATALVIVPAYGQLYPKRVPFLFAFRPYAGNWRVGWVIIKKGNATQKITKLKTFDSVFGAENAQLIMGTEPETVKQLDYFTTANMLLYPHIRTCM